MWLIEFDSDTMVRVDLKANKVVISPRAQNIPQILALAFSMSILHRLCIPDYSHPSQTADSGFISAPFESLEDRVCRDDSNEDMPCGWNDDLPNSAGDNTWGGESLEGVESGCGSTGDAVAGSGGWVEGDRCSGWGCDGLESDWSGVGEDGGGSCDGDGGGSVGAWR